MRSSPKKTQTFLILGFVCVFQRCVRGLVLHQESDGGNGEIKSCRSRTLEMTDEELEQSSKSGFNSFFFLFKTGAIKVINIVLLYYNSVLVHRIIVVHLGMIRH